MKTTEMEAPDLASAPPSMPKGAPKAERKAKDPSAPKKKRKATTPEQRAEALRKRADDVLARAARTKAKRFAARSKAAIKALTAMADTAPSEETAELCKRLAEELGGIGK